MLAASNTMSTAVIAKFMELTDLYKRQIMNKKVTTVESTTEEKDEARQD